jgi:hypothetical protein
VPSLDVHSTFIGWAEDHLSGRRDRALLAADGGAIGHLS